MNNRVKHSFKFIESMYEKNVKIDVKRYNDDVISNLYFCVATVMIYKTHHSKDRRRTICIRLFELITTDISNIQRNTSKNHKIKKITRHEEKS